MPITASNKKAVIHHFNMMMNASRAAGLAALHQVYKK
jgi:citrate lyase beta subunit